ncbi:MAG TPA: hypothetical protein VHG28_22475, partial [Longimicrobiaceae bacterium]|nr:hypothetical protein [Longimicrobiaceae bacterium]
KRCCMGRDQAVKQVQHRFGLAPVGEAGRPAGDVWQVDLAPLAVRIDAEPGARPAAVLVVENGVVLHVELQNTPPAEPEEVAAELERAIMHAANQTGSWPERVEVRDAEVARYLSRALARREVEVVRATRLEALDVLAADLREHLTGLAPTAPAATSPETWLGWGLPRETIAELFRAAADFWRRHPWRWLPSDVPIFALEGTSRPWTCTVLGNAGEEFGLALYAETDDFFRMFEDGPPFANATGPILSLTYDRATDLPQRMRREVAAAGWEVAGPDAYPVLITINTPGGGLPRAVAEDLTRLLRAVPEFVAHHREALDTGSPPEEPLEWRSPGTGVLLRLEAEGELRVDTHWEPVEYLAPCLPGGPGADPRAALDLTLDPPGGVDDLMSREMAAVDRFEDALRADGLSDATVRKHVTNAATFVEMLAFYQGVPVRAVTEYDLRSFLFDLYPRKVRDAAYRAEAMPTSLTRFFEFLGEREGIVCPWAGAVLAERDAYRDRIVTFPGGFWWDEGVEEWRTVLTADLIDRAMIHWPKHADDTPWGPTMGPEEAGLEHEVQRLWLFWRDEAILGGLSDPHQVRKAAIERQLAWEQTPHPRLDGRTPLQVIQAERREREAADAPRSGR